MPGTSDPFPTPVWPRGGVGRDESGEGGLVTRQEEATPLRRTPPPSALPPPPGQLEGNCGAPGNSRLLSSRPRRCAPRDRASERWAHGLVQVYSLTRREGVYSVSAYAAARRLQNLRKGGERTQCPASYCRVMGMRGLPPWTLGKTGPGVSGRQRSDKPEFA